MHKVVILQSCSWTSRRAFTTRPTRRQNIRLLIIFCPGLFCLINLFHFARSVIFPPTYFLPVWPFSNCILSHVSLGSDHMTFALFDPANTYLSDVLTPPLHVPLIIVALFAQYLWPPTTPTWSPCGLPSAPWCRWWAAYAAPSSASCWPAGSPGGRRPGPRARWTPSWGPPTSCRAPAPRAPVGRSAWGEREVLLFVTIFDYPASIITTSLFSSFSSSHKWFTHWAG